MTPGEFVSHSICVSNGWKLNVHLEDTDQLFCLDVDPYEMDNVSMMKVLPTFAITYTI